MIRILSIALALLASLPAFASERLVVIELFTSQGCPNCPPAQGILSEVAEGEGVLVLSWPVDYWDFMGWKDTLARPGNALRQEAYNRELRQPGVYTPQVVVDGLFEGVGSRRETVRNRIEQARALDRSNAGVTLIESDGYCIVQMPSVDAVIDGPVFVEAIYYRAEMAERIVGGDNRGLTMAYRNVVLAARSLGQWSQSLRVVRIPVGDATAVGADHMAILLHRGTAAGPIVGAASMALPPAF